MRINKNKEQNEKDIDRMANEQVAEDNTNRAIEATNVKVAGNEVRQSENIEK